jgi:proteasome assembly chaperone (PAC2) family protein
MKETLVSRIKEVTLKDPILIEGLPGVHWKLAICGGS